MANLPEPEKKEGLRAFTAPYIQYYSPLYSNLIWKDQEVWREIVNSQPIATLCRETIIEKLSTIDWRVEPKDPTKRQELRTEIEYYERLFEQNNGLDWIGFLEWILGDALDLPFGGGCELVYRSDNPSKRLVDYIPLDGATLFPTYNREYPVVQRVPGMEALDPVVFPAHSLNRLYYSPRREIRWKGWGTPPPEKIYLALSMLVQGDKYYWKLLVDTPEAGILDLIDMEKESAELWLESLRTLMSGNDPLKVPVLYQHNTPAKFIPFGRPPSEILYDSTTMKYAAITCAGYGLSLGDIGLRVSENGGGTLAGTIRDDRNSNRKGIGFAKVKVRLFMNRMLPNGLNFTWVDPDEERQVATGRAKLSSATSYNTLISNRVISPKEARQDMIASGLFSTTLPEDIPEEDMKLFDEIEGGDPNPPARENMLTATQPPSLGGQGEVRMSRVDDLLEESVLQFVESIFEVDLPEDELLEYIVAKEFPVTDKIQDGILTQYQSLFEQSKKEKSIFSLSRYQSFDETEAKKAISRAVTKTARNVAPLIISAKSDALDNSSDLSDNFNVEIVNAGNQIIEVLARNLNQEMKGIV